MKSIVVTTSVKTNNELNEKAHNIANFLILITSLVTKGQLSKC